MELDVIYNADCLEAMKSIPDKSIDLVVTDPPYLFDNGRWYSSDAMGEKTLLGKNTIFNSDGDLKKMGTFGEQDMDRFLSTVMPKMKVPNAYIFCSETQVPLYGMWARNHKLHFSICVWEKPLSIINKNRFSQNTEFIVRIYDFGTALNKLDDNELYSKVCRAKIVRGGKCHPTQKPVELIEKFIKLSSKAGDVVLDPFIGSGTTAEACINLNRHYIGYEIDEKFYATAKSRTEKHWIDKML